MQTADASDPTMHPGDIATRRARPLSRLCCVLAAAIVAAPIMAAAQGSGDNFANVDQDGSDNSADITQGGVDNFAGSDTRPMIQNGFWNRLTILQAGDGNLIGTGPDGLRQEGLFTTETVSNVISIEQFSDENSVGSIDQRSLGGVPNGANSLDIRQGPGGENQIGLAAQVQYSGEAPQFMTLIQSGRGNRIAAARQVSLTTDRTEPNVMRVDLSGERNGQGALLGAAALPRLASSSLVQQGGAIDPRGNGNFADLRISGNDNAFGIHQGGRLNSVGTVFVGGALNAIGLRQDGDENDIVLSVIEGDDNILGVDQSGTNYFATSLIGRSGDNAIFADQQGVAETTVSVAGDRNVLTMRQDFLTGSGGKNVIALSIVGNESVFDILQSGENTMRLEIFGERNGSTAGRLSDTAGGALESGRILQVGDGNDTDISATGDLNRIALSQEGDLNAILTAIRGDENEATFLQSGSKNSAGLRQVGMGNRAMFRQ